LLADGSPPPEHALSPNAALAVKKRRRAETRLDSSFEIMHA
jgi:hypothetical protein